MKQVYTSANTSVNMKKTSGNLYKSREAYHR